MKRDPSIPVISQEDFAAASNQVIADSIHAVGHIVRDVLGKTNSGNAILEAAYRLAETRKLSERATAIILHSLDLFIADDCKVVEGCTHFEGLEIPTREEMEQLINVISEHGLATLPPPAATGEEAAEPTAKAGLADILKNITQAHENVPESSDEPDETVVTDAEEASANTEVTNLLVRFMFQLRAGVELNKESLEAEMVKFRAELVESLTATPGDGTQGGKFLEAAIATGVKIPTNLVEIEAIITGTRSELVKAL